MPKQKKVRSPHPVRPSTRKARDAAPVDPDYPYLRLARRRRLEVEACGCAVGGRMLHACGLSNDLLSFR